MKSTKKTTLSNRVEQLRKEHHLSQTELGDMMLLTTKSIGLIESGNNSNLFNYIKLADIFKLLFVHSIASHDYTDSNKFLAFTPYITFLIFAIRRFISYFPQTALSHLHKS